MSVEAKFLFTSLVLVAGLLIAYLLIRRASLKGHGLFGQGLITVLGRYPVGHSSYLLMVKFHQVILLLGVTAHEIKVLHEITDTERIKEIEELAQKQATFRIKDSFQRRTNQQ